MFQPKSWDIRRGGRREIRYLTLTTLPKFNNFGKRSSFKMFKSSISNSLKNCTNQSKIFSNTTTEEKSFEAWYIYSRDLPLLTCSVWVLYHLQKFLCLNVQIVGVPHYSYVINTSKMKIARLVWWNSNLASTKERLLGVLPLLRILR